MPVSIQQKVYIGLGLLFVLLLAIGVFADRTVVQLVADSKRVQHSLDVKKSVDELQSLIADVQAIKNVAVSKRIQVTITAIKNLTADDERQQGQLDVLGPLITAEITNPNPSPE